MNSVYSVYGGEPDVDILETMKPAQAKLLFWALMGDLHGTFPGDPEIEISDYGEKTAEAFLQKHPEIEDWYRDSGAGRLMDRLEAFAEDGLYRGALSWNIKCNAAFPDFTNEDVETAVENAWQALTEKAANDSVALEREGRNGGHAVLFRRTTDNWERLELPFPKACPTARAVAFMLLQRDILDEILETVDSMDAMLEHGGKRRMIAEQLQALHDGNGPRL